MPSQALRLEMVDRETAAVLRRKSPRERLEIAFRMWSTTRAMLAGMLRRENPEWSDQDVDAEITRRLSGGPG